jgi:hypothetical protein
MLEQGCAYGGTYQVLICGLVDERSIFAWGLVFSLHAGTRKPNR